MRNLASALIAISIASCANADVLKLKNGKSIAGSIVSMDANEVRMKRCGATEIYPRADVEGIATENAPEDCNIPPPVRKLELSAATQIRLKLLDYIDTVNEPPGKAFRAQVVEPVSVEGSTIIGKNAAFLIHLVSLSEDAQTLDVVGVNLGGGEWASFRPLSPVAVMSSIGAITDVRKQNENEPPLEPIVVRGKRVFAPSLTVLTFTLKTPVRLAIAPPMR